MITKFMRRVVPARYRPVGYLTALVQRRTARCVRLGPFTGMRYIDRSIGSAYLPKLLGTYERELTAIIEQACAARPRLIVDVGAAEGYYAVGLALRNPQANVLAFEQDPAGRAALTELATQNGVQTRIEIRGRCDPVALQQALSSTSREFCSGVPQPAFLVCDVEGNESHLLDPIEAPALSIASILVETHDFIYPGITAELQRRFAPTHHVECLWQTGRSRAEFPFRTWATALLPKSYLEFALNEWRPCRMCWLWMTPYA